MEYDGDDYTKWKWRFWNSCEKLRKRAGRVGNRGTNRDYPNYIIVEVDQNTEKSPGDLMKLIITQTLVICFVLLLINPFRVI